jgi:hypothetical protein
MRLHTLDHRSSSLPFFIAAILLAILIIGGIGMILR